MSDTASCGVAGHVGVFARMLGEIEQLGLARPQSERHQLPVALADGATERLHIDQNVAVRRGLVVSLAVEGWSVLRLAPARASSVGMMSTMEAIMLPDAVRKAVLAA